MNKCRIIDLPKIHDPRGNLSFIEGTRHIPFEIKRVYYMYDIPCSEIRGGHAHKNLHQVLIAMAGSLDVVLDDGSKKETISLSRSDQGLYMPKMIWHDLVNFSVGAVCMSLASDFYDERDYYRNYEEFLSECGRGIYK